MRRDMLSKNLYFIHNFDAKMHYSIYYSLLKVKDNDGIHLNDSVQSKKCNRDLGRWNFIVDDEDYSHGVYHALEIIRQSIFSAKENNKSSVDIAFVSTKNDSDACYVFNYEEEFENYIDIERLKKTKVFRKNNENCECDAKISKRIFFKVIKPVLEEVFRKTDYQITTKVFKDKTVSERFGQFLINFKQDLDVIHIEWSVDKFFNDLIMDQNAAEMELQLTA
jgi:hypothetical protein